MIGAALLGVAGIGVVYVRAVEAKEEATRRALEDESKESQALAEQRTREVQQKQAEIDRLLGSLADSPSKDTVKELQRQIREAGSEAGEKERKGSGNSPGRATTAGGPAPAAPVDSAPVTPGMSSAPKPEFTSAPKPPFTIGRDF